MRKRNIKVFSSVNLKTSFSVKTVHILPGKSDVPKILKSCSNMGEFDLLVLLVRNPQLQPWTWNSESLGKVFKELPQLLRLNDILSPEP